MKTLILIVTFGLTLLTSEGVCQRDKSPRYFGNPILTDSLSTIFLPTRYNEEFLSANKIAFWGDYYANLVVYDFRTDTYRKLFSTDTYIRALQNNYSYGNQANNKIELITTKWVFLFVKNKDLNNNGRIDDNDPTILFVTTTKGENLKSLTDETENVISIDIFETQGFGLIKIQRDANHDKSFKGEDKDFYYKKIDLNNLSFGNGIEVR